MSDELAELKADVKKILRLLEARHAPRSAGRTTETLARLAQCIFDVTDPGQAVAVSALIVRASWQGKDFGRLRLALECIAPIEHKSAAKRIGQALLRASKIPDLEGLRVECAGTHRKVALWRVVEVEP